MPMSKDQAEKMVDDLMWARLGMDVEKDWLSYEHFLRERQRVVDALTHREQPTTKQWPYDEHHTPEDIAYFEQRILGQD